MLLVKNAVKWRQVGETQKSAVRHDTAYDQRFSRRSNTLTEVGCGVTKVGCGVGDSPETWKPRHPPHHENLGFGRQVELAIAEVVYK